MIDVSGWHTMYFGLINKGETKEESARKTNAHFKTKKKRKKKKRKGGRK